MKKAEYMRYRNAIERWQRDESESSGLRGGTENAQSDENIMYCSGCRAKASFERVPSERNGRLIVMKCLKCGKTVKRPDPTLSSYPLGVAFLEAIERNGTRGMTMVTVDLLIELGHNPINETPIIEDKAVATRGAGFTPEFLREKGVDLSKVYVKGGRPRR